MNVLNPPAPPSGAAALNGSRPAGARPLRVLLAAPSLDPASGGIAGVSRSIARLLQDQARAGLIECRCLALHGQSQSACEPFAHAFAGSRWRFSWAVLRALSTWADMAVFTHVGLASLLLLLPRRLRPLSVVFLHGIEVWTQLSGRKRAALEQADLLVANSHFTAARARTCNPSLDAIEICHLGIPDFPPPPCHAQAPVERQDILIVGRMAAGERYKGHAELIAALPRVLESVPGARLIVAGAGDDQSRYVAQAQAAGVAGHVVFTGPVTADRLWQLYRDAALLAMPSRGEGFGLVYLEAMRAGIVCLASTADAAGEIVQHDETGQLVDPADEAQLAGALSRLLLEVDWRCRLGAAGRRRFEDHFTEACFHERFWTLLQSIVPATAHNPGASSR